MPQREEILRDDPWMGSHYISPSSRLQLKPASPKDNGVASVPTVVEGALIADRKDERRLVKRMLAGDQRAFSTFFHRFFPVLYRFALTRVPGDEDLAEEIAQQSLCKAIDHAASWRGEAQLLTWLCSICRRELAQHFRKVNRTPTRVELTEELPEVRAALESLRADDGDPEQLAMRDEIAGLVHVALDRLPSHYAQALEWKYFEGDSIKEIATRLGTTPKAVESMLTRARGAYRDVLSALLAGHEPLQQGGVR
jgi:RNA polymerase sigma-70 factor (ECF subfamily)